jgi:hypothetical protein
MVMSELLIVSPKNRLPYTYERFRDLWRAVTAVIWSQIDPKLVLRYTPDKTQFTCRRTGLSSARNRLQEPHGVRDAGGH